MIDQIQKGRESWSQRSTHYSSFDNSSNLNGHFAISIQNRIKRNIVQKMVERQRKGAIPCRFCRLRREPEGKRRRSPEVLQRNERFYHRVVSLPLFIIRNRGRESSFVAVLTVWQKRKRQIYARPVARIATPPLFFPSPFPSNAINPRSYDQPAVIKSGTGNSSRS